MSPEEPPIIVPAEDTTTSLPVKNTLWTKVIPITNMVFMVISLLLVFGLDLLILIANFSLLIFWIEMLIVFGLFLIFFGYERHISKNMLSVAPLPIDKWIYLLIIVRNIVIILNFIPFIQLIGAFFGFYGIIPYLIVYILLNSRRSRTIERG